MTKIVVAEKPSVARDIARVLGANRRGEGYIQGRGYTVTWALGHLIHYAEPNDYGPPWDGHWSFNQLPMFPQTWKLKTLDRTASQFQVIEKLLNDPQTEYVICATDAGREGEHIFRLIYQHAGCRKPVKRLWVSSLTDEAIYTGFAHLKNGLDFDPLARAARARAQADWVVGLNLTRAYTVHHGTLCPIGRVQTPTLAMIVARDQAIANFSKAFYYELAVNLKEGFQAKLVLNAQTRIDSKVQAERHFRELEPHRTGLISKFQKKLRNVKPPQLYDLITLQKEANKRYGYTASKVLELAQQLYERHKAITYPRTESRHISEDMVPQLSKTLERLPHPLVSAALERVRAGLKLSKRYVDTQKLSDHHGIIPTGKPAQLSGPLAHIYHMIVARFVAIFLSDQVIEDRFVDLKIATALFRAKGSRTLDSGWLEAVYPKKEEKSQKIPDLVKGQSVHVAKLVLLEKETNPPKPFTDATLLAAMKLAGRDIEDDRLAAAMRESGLGTPATRAEILEKLLRTKLAERQKKAIISTEKGRALIGVVADTLRQPELTGEWERQLKEIEDGKYDAARFDTSIQTYVSQILEQVRGQAPLGDRFPDGKNKQPIKAASRFNRNPLSAGAPDKRASPKAPAGQEMGQQQRFDAGPCPSCKQGRIIKGHRSFGCTRYTKGCHLLIPQKFGGKKLSENQVATLVTKKVTRTIKGFIDASGKKFNAALALNAQFELEFHNIQMQVPKKLHCPKCQQGTIIEGKRGYGCNRFRRGCSFVIWKDVSGKSLSLKQVTQLIGKGYVKMKGLKNQDGKSFAAVLRLQPDGKVHMEPT